MLMGKQSTIGNSTSLLAAETIRRKCRRATTRRKAHLIDADNLLGDPRTTDTEVIRATFDRYKQVAGYERGDHVVIGTGRNGLHVLEIELAWPGAQYVRRSGVDGADIELLEVATWLSSTARFDEVIIGSGDRIFLVAFEELLGAGLEVAVVSRHRGLAKCLASRAHGRIRYLGSSSPRMESAAA